MKQINVFHPRLHVHSHRLSKRQNFHNAIAATAATYMYTLFLPWPAVFRPDLFKLAFEFFRFDAFGEDDDEERVDDDQREQGDEGEQGLTACQ